MCMFDIAVSRKSIVQSTPIQANGTDKLVIPPNPRRIWMQLQDSSGVNILLAIPGNNPYLPVALTSRLTPTGTIQPLTIQSHPGIIHLDLITFAVPTAQTCQLTEVVIDYDIDTDIQAMMAQLSKPR